MSDKTLKEAYRPIVWNYFKLHANQRIILFRFYIVFFSLFAIVIGHLIGEFHFLSDYQEVIVIVLSAVFLCITIVFWMLDNRNRYFIHNAEDYFVRYESSFSKIQPETDRFIILTDTAKIFTRERDDKGKNCFLYRHTSCFRIIYIIGIVLALVFVGFAIYSICYHDNKILHRIEITNIEKLKR